MKFKNTTTPLSTKYVIAHYFTTEFDELVVILGDDYEDYVEFLKQWYKEDLIKVTKAPFKKYSKV